MIWIKPLLKTFPKKSTAEESTHNKTFLIEILIITELFYIIPRKNKNPNLFF